METDQISSMNFNRRNVSKTNKICQRYDFASVHKEYKDFSNFYSISLSEAVIVKEYMSIVIKYNLCNKMENCIFITGILKSAYPQIIKHVFNMILNRNEETKNLDLLEKKKIYKSLPIIKDNIEYKIYELFKEINPKGYNAFITKKFSTSIHNVIVTLNKIAGNDLIYVNKGLYCLSDSKWTNDHKILAKFIKNCFLTYFTKEAKRVGFDGLNLSKFEDPKFLFRIINHYRVHKRLKYFPVKFNILKNELIFFTNFLYGIPKINHQYYFYYNPNYYNTVSTNYEYREPKQKYLNNIDMFFTMITSSNEIKKTLVNFCCSAIIYQPINLLLVITGDKIIKKIFFDLLLDMLGDYGMLIDANLLVSDSSTVDLNQLKHKRLIVLQQNNEIICNDRLNLLFDKNICSTYFYDSNQEPIFKQDMSYNLTRKIVKIALNDDLNSNLEFIRLVKNNNLPEFIKKHKCALFKYLQDYGSTNYNHHTCNSVWYFDNVDKVSKIQVIGFKNAYKKL